MELHYEVPSRWHNRPWQNGVLKPMESTIEIFAPIAKINIVQVLLSLAANLDYQLWQFNSKNTFLHGESSKKVCGSSPMMHRARKTVQIKEIYVQG